MERKIGEIFELGNEWYQCLEQPEKYDETVCSLCAFQDDNGNCELEMCSGTYRSDKKSVIFKKLEKIGGTLGINKKTYQCIKPIYHKGCTGCAFYGSCRYICSGQGIYVEIKTKEDMEENKLNLKPFDLEAAKAGKPVCTRGGAKARIICFDAKSDAPIVALVTIDDGTEITFDYLSDGTFLNRDNPENDLMMLPEKKEGWVNIYALNTCYSSKEEAEANIDRDYEDEYVRTVKIEWEE